MPRRLLIRRKLPAKEVELASTKSVLDAKEATLRAKFRDCVQLNYDLGAARATVGRGERVTNELAEEVYTGYIPSMRAQASDYRDHLNVLLANAELRGEYLGGYQVRVWDEGHSSHLRDADGIKELGGRTPTPQGNGKVVVSPPPPSF